MRIKKSEGRRQKALAGMADGQWQMAERLLTRVGLARALRVSVRTVDRMLAEKRIPFLRFRCVVRFRLADVERALLVPPPSLSYGAASPLSLNNPVSKRVPSGTSVD